jgi:ribosomal RNA-processing protein 12
MTGEVLLCLKDSKAKTRDTAYQVLISLANATGNMTDFLRVIAAALGAETSHMRSAAVLASSRLVFEFAREDDSLQGALPSLLQTILILFNEQSREVIKSAVGFVRVCVAAMQPEQLRPLLPDVVGSILKYHKGKDRFRAKIKIILKKLVKIYGYETLMPFVPETETRLLTHMRKLEERAARRRAANREDGAQGPQNFDDMVDSDEYDSDEGKTLMTGATGLTRKAAKTQMSAKSGALSQTSKTRASSVRSKATMAGTVRLPSENDGEVVNILNLNKKQVQFADEDSDSDSDGILEFDDHGRLVVNDDDDMQDEVVDMADAVHEHANIGSNSNKRRKLNKGGESESVNSGKSKSKNDRNKKVRDLGASYKSRKAGGDVKKKGQKFEPYAYVPLDGRSYSKKNRRRAVEQMATVVPQGGKRKRK